MRVLWVTGAPPRLDGGGDTIRQSHLLHAVASRHPTDLLVAGDFDDPHSGSVLRAVQQVPVEDGPPRGRWARRLRDLRHLLPGRLPMEAVVTSARREALQQALADGAADDHDLVVVEHSWLAPLLPVSRTGRWCVTFHYLPSAFLDQAAAVAGSRRVRLLKQVDARRARRLERWAVDAYDATIAVSEDDARRLGTDIVVPNGVDTDAIRPTPLPERPTLVFVGTLGFLPNVEGIRWFCEQVLPEVARAVPDVRLTVVGRDPVPEVRALASDRVEVVASPPSVLPYVQRARVALVPIRIGSGTRLKALEAMAAGRPVVGTTIGLDGLGIVDGEHALVRDDAAGTATAVTRLLQDDATARRLVARGRAHVEQHYGWSTIGNRLVEHLEAVADAP